MDAFKDKKVPENICGSGAAKINYLVGFTTNENSKNNSNSFNKGSVNEGH